MIYVDPAIMGYLQWIFQVLLMLPLIVLSTKYSKQIIAIVDNENAVQEAAKYLYDKNPTVSQVVKWLPTDPNNPSGGKQFKLVEWSPTANDFVEQTTGSPPNVQPRAIEDLPHGGRIQVVGHGKLDGATNKITLGGMDAMELSTALKTLPTSTTTSGAIKRVSLVGCSVGELNAAGTDFIGDRFPEVLLTDMKDNVDEVSSRTGIVGVDSTGRKVYGEQTAAGTVWRPKEGSITKTVIRLDSNNVAQRVEKKIGRDTATYESPQAIKKGFNPIGGSLELEETQASGGAANPEHVNMDNDELFNVVNSVAKEHFQSVSVDPNWDTQVENERAVKMLDQGTVSTLKIREFDDFQKLTKEIKHWGEKGFEYPSYDANRKAWRTTNSAGEPMTDKFIYYRYGDFVYSLKVQSDLQVGGSRGPPKGLNPFYIALEGVIVNEDPTNPVGTRKNTGLDLTRYKFGDAYRQISFLMQKSGLVVDILK